MEEERSRSKYQYEILPDGRERIFSLERGDFFIDCIRDPNNPKIDAIKKFMMEFDPKESDPDMIAFNVSDQNYGYYLLEDKDGKPIGYSQSVLINFLSPDQIEEQPKKAIIFNGHIFIKKEERRKGLAYEMMQTTLREFGEGAKAQDRILVGVAGECLATSEKFWNSLGSKRLFFEDKEGNFNEIAYLQPPLEWHDKEKGIPLDPETGEPSTIENCSVYEHMMVRMFDDRQEIEVEDIMKIVRTIYEDSYEGKEYDGGREWPAIQAELEKIQNILENQLRQSINGRLRMLNFEERQQLEEELKQKGKKINHLLTEEEFI